MENVKEMSKKVLTKKQFLSTQDIQREYVDLTEFGYDGGVFAQTLSGKQSDRYQADMLNLTEGGSATPNRDAMANMSARLVTLGAVREDGKRLFDYVDAKELGKKNSKALGKIAKVIRRLSGMDEKIVKGMEKNSETSQSEDSDSD